MSGLITQAFQHSSSVHQHQSRHMASQMWIKPHNRLTIICDNCFTFKLNGLQITITMHSLFKNRCCKNWALQQWVSLSHMNGGSWQWKQGCDQTINPGSLSDHHDVCPQALLSLSLSVCLFVSLNCFSEWREVPHFPYKRPGIINRKMKDRPVNAGRCFERIKRLETDGFAQWHRTFLSQAVTPLSQLVYIRTTSAAWEPSSDTVNTPLYRITFSLMNITINKYTLIQHAKHCICTDRWKTAKVKTRCRHRSQRRTRATSTSSVHLNLTAQVGGCFILPRRTRTWLGSQECWINIIMLMKLC